MCYVKKVLQLNSNLSRSCCNVSLSLSLFSESFSRLTWIHPGHSGWCQDKAAGHGREIQHTCYCATMFLIFVSLSTKIKVSVSGGVWGGGAGYKNQRRQNSAPTSQPPSFSAAGAGDAPPTRPPNLEATLLVLLDRADSIAGSDPILWPITTR